MDGWKKMLNNFIDCIHNKSSPFVSLEEAVGSLELANGITISYFKNRPAYFPISQK